ncbi:MAG: hypothetical protein RLZZ356_1644, partial [Verrucomicrobiota bacterium]
MEGFQMEENPWKDRDMASTCFKP